MMAHRGEKTDLPKLPPKAKVRLDHPAFREPSHDASKKRQESLQNEIQEQQEKLQQLKQEQEELRQECRRELDVVGKQLKGRHQWGERGPRGLSDAFRQSLEETALELELATGQGDDEETLEGERIKERIKRAEAAIEKQNQAVELEQLGENELEREIETVEGYIAKLNREDSVAVGAGDTDEELEVESKEEFQEGKETNGETGNEADPETGEEHDGGKENGADEETTENSIRETGKETDGEAMDRTGEDRDGKAKKQIDGEKGGKMEEEPKGNSGARQKKELKLAKQRELQEQKGRLKEREKELERQRQRKKERELQVLKDKLKDLKLNKAKRMKARQEAQRELEKMHTRKGALEQNLKRVHQQQPERDHEQEELERQKREQEQVAQRKMELERQQMREGHLKGLRSELREMQFFYLRRRFRDLDGYEDQPHVREFENMLTKAEQLEAKLTEVLRLKRRLAQVEDMLQALEREKRSEERLGEPSLEASVTLQGKDHISGNDIKIYKPLEEDQIRLLIVWPAPMDCYPLICTLRTESLEKDPKPTYAALSYFWGTDAPNARLYLLRGEPQGGYLDQANWGSTAQHAMRIPIRNNLFRALLRLRRENDPVALWVDVMCINQEDKKEKTVQLRKMVNIYRMAENVCIWLGEDDCENRSNAAMEFIPTIMDFAVLDSLAKDKEHARKWYGLSVLMRDRWFSRRWIVQEISLAKQASIHCGAKSVQWLDFVDAVSILVSNQEKIKKLFDLSEWREGHDAMGEVQSFGANILLQATSRLFLRTEDGEIVKPIKSLESLVTSLKTFDTSDQRDLIYSLVSIASDTYELSEGFYSRRDEEKRGRIDLPVDYSKSEIEVYKDFTKFCICSSKSLDIICRHWAMPVKKTRNDKEGQVTLPSWIPLLTDSEFGEPEQVYGGRKNGDNLVGPVGQRRYNASADREPDVKFEPEGESDSLGQKAILSDARNGGNKSHTGLTYTPPSCLRVKGFRLAKIKKVSLRNTAGLILRESLQMGGWTGIQNHTESVPDKIWRTLIADRDPDGQIPPTWYQRACLRCLELADTFNNGDLNIGQLLQGNSDMLRAYLTRVRNTIWNRKFFTADIRERAENGVTFNRLPEVNGEEPQAREPQWENETVKRKELFGLCPAKTEEKDFACILYGCSVPVILREKPSASNKSWFEVIGEAYVHGKMDGEAIADFRDKLTLAEKEEYFDLG